MHHRNLSSRQKTPVTSVIIWYDKVSIFQPRSFICRTFDHLLLNMLRAEQNGHHFADILKCIFLNENDCSLIGSNFIEVYFWGFRQQKVCIGLDNGFVSHRQCIPIGTLGRNGSWILIKIQTFSFKKINLEMLSAKWSAILFNISYVKGVSWIYNK